MTRLPTYFVSHGGGPWPWLTGPFRREFDRLEASLHDVAREIGAKPKAVLVTLGHWDEDRFTVQAGERPGMMYDYGGFPPETYRIHYPSPGAPDVARRVLDLLKSRQGFPRRSIRIVATTMASMRPCTPCIRRRTSRCCSCR